MTEEAGNGEVRGGGEGTEIKREECMELRSCKGEGCPPPKGWTGSQAPSL